MKNIILAITFLLAYSISKGQYPCPADSFTSHPELNKFVGENKFVLGYLTIADFIVSEDSHYIRRLYPE